MTRVAYFPLGSAVSPSAESSISISILSPSQGECYGLGSHYYMFSFPSFSSLPMGSILKHDSKETLCFFYLKNRKAKD